MKLFFSNIVFLFTLCSSNYAQDTSKFMADRRVDVNPEFTGVQLELTTLLLISEIGALIDYNIASSGDKFFNLGLRFSGEHYSLVSFGGDAIGSPFTNYNLLARYSLRGRILWFDLVGGLSYYTTSDPYLIRDQILTRAGFEVGYHFLNNMLGVVINSSTSFKENTFYFGLGLTFGFYNY